MKKVTNPTVTFLLMLTIFFAPNATSQEQENTRNKFSLQKVSVSPDVKIVPPEPYFKSISQNSFGLGLVGNAINESPEGAKTILRQILDDNHIDVAEIVRTEFVNQLRTKRVFGQIDEASSDGTFKLEIRRYGLFKKSIFSFELRPVFWIHASFVRGDGAELWSKRYSAPTYDDQLPSGTLEYFQKNPEVLREGFQKHAQQAATELTADLLKP